MARLRWRIDAKEECPECREITLRRAEPFYRMVVKIFLGASLLVLPLLQIDRRGGEIPAWATEGTYSFLFSIATFLFLSAFVVIGWYEVYDRKQSYYCRACGYRITIPAKPFSALEKVMIVLFCSVMAIVLLSALVLYGSTFFR